MAAVLRK